MGKVKVNKRVHLIVRIRANGYCEYCKSHENCGTDPFVTEHIIPRLLNGLNILSNLAYSCGGCNINKSTKIEGLDEISNQIAPFYNPRTQIWGEHFTWNSKATHIVGITPTGRVTVDTLKLNRLQLVILRKGMFLLGIHPPK
jgi:5-methylcytosine-specific restriction endonuclease McrA